jgi:hypothetical protein
MPAGRAVCRAASRAWHQDEEGVACQSVPVRALQITATGTSRGGGVSQVAYRTAGPVLVVLKRESARGAAVDGTLTDPRGPVVGWVVAEDGTRTDLRGPVVALLFETGEWVEYGNEAAVSTLEFSAARESDIGFHPCGPLDAPAGPQPPHRR